MKKRIVLLLAVATMFVGMLGGCGKEEDTTEEIGTTTEDEVKKPEVKEEPETLAPTEETETEPEKPDYTYTDMSTTKYAQKSVNVRDLPNTDGAKLGALSVNQEVKVTGQCNETSWYRIEYKGSVAYVSNNYLGDNKVEEKKPEPKPENNQPADNPAPAPEQPSANLESCPYTLNTWSMEGGHAVYYTTTNTGNKVPDPAGLKPFCEPMRPHFDFDCYYHAAGYWETVGNYAEGTVYKYHWGYHITANDCPNWPNCHVIGSEF